MATTSGASRLAQAGQRRSVALLNNAALLRALFRPLQRFCPTVTLGQRVIVTRHADVCEVLQRDEDFTIAEVNGATMDRVNGPFILGMDRSAQVLREKAILRQAVRPGDLDGIRTEVRQTAADLVGEAQPGGRIDVVQGLARLVAVRLVRTYFGVAGPDETTMARWMRTIFHETFLNIGQDPEVRREGERSAAEFHAYADDLIARRRCEIAGGQRAPDDFLTRLVAQQGDPDAGLSDESIRRNVGGVVVGAVETTSKAVAHSVDQLLRRPQALGTASAAARAYDMDAVTAHVLEALRFNPLNPVLSRHVARPTVLAVGTRRERRLPAGRSVYAAILAAMFDPAVFGDPAAFRTDRTASAYLHFGHGLHTCFGEQINLVQIPEVVAALLRLGHLRRAPGDAGTIAYSGPFPDRLVVEFDPLPVTSSPARVAP